LFFRLSPTCHHGQSLTCLGGSNATVFYGNIFTTMDHEYEEKLKFRIAKLEKDMNIFLFPRNEVSESIYVYCKENGYSVDYFSVNNISLCDVLVICEDELKVKCLNELSKFNWGNKKPKVILAGRKHHDLTQTEAIRVEKKYELDSHAVGYSSTKSHILESIRYLVNQKMTGWVIELGTFRGGTLALIEKIFEEIKYRENVKIAGFDTWGTVAAHSFLDLFSMSEWISRPEDFEVARSKVTSDVLLCKGDIAESFRNWAKDIKDPIIFAFIDTDNFTPVNSSLPVLWEKLSVGGIIIFDHLYTHEEFYNTIGEHVAAVNFFKDRTDYYHLSETGAYLKVK